MTLGAALPTVAHSPRVRGLPRLSTHHLLVVLTLAVTFPLQAAAPTYLVDLGWTLESGEWMVHHRQLLVEDPFTAAPKLPDQVNAPWLAQLAYFGLYTLGGYALLIAVSALLGTLAFGIVLAAALSASGSVRYACSAVLLAYLLGATNLGARPQLLAYPLFATFLFVTTRYLHGRASRLLWLLPPLMLVWVNLHGSWVLGLVLLGAAIGGRFLETRSWQAVRSPLVVFFVCLVATLVNPYGLGMWQYVLFVANSPISRDLVGEWAPPALSNLPGGVFLTSVVVLAAAALLSRNRLTWTHWISLLTFGLLALSASRAVIWWGFASAPILAYLLAGIRRSPDPLLPARLTHPTAALLNGLLAALVVALLALTLPWTKGLNPTLPDAVRALVRPETPTRVGAFLRDYPYPGVLFNQGDWGGYFVWSLPPDRKPFIDGRVEIYPLAVWHDYIAIMTPRTDWRALLEKYGLRTLALSKEQATDLVAVVRAQPDWQAVYEDDQAIVFVLK